VTKLLKGILTTIIITISVGCCVAENRTNTLSTLIDFGDPNTKRLVQKLNTLAKNRNSNQVVNITQFGDSHSAADFFTGEFRTLMQQKYGDAGIGWITPIAIKGQNNTAVNWQEEGWTILSSRTLNGLDFPMGGFIAKPTNNAATIQITPKNINNSNWQIKLTFKILKNTPNLLSIYDTNNKKINIHYSPKTNVWQTTSFITQSPFTIKANPDIEIGGIWLIRSQQSGVIVSSIATNGAKQSIWQKWGPNWLKELSSSKSDLIILEYGTNESFDDIFDANTYQKNLVDNIRQIRKSLPNAAILLMTPPDTMATEKSIPKSFSKVINIQKQVAKSEKTLFWDWQTAMGGPHSIKDWQKRELARPDLVHQTLQGYKESARIFYTDFNEFIKKKR
jgi:hypothetical protein